MIQHIDTHSHTYFPEYDHDREVMFERMRQDNVTTISVGTNLITSRQAVQSAFDHSEVIGATVGLHPNRAHEGFDEALFSGLFAAHGSSPAVVAIGECGLDYYREPDEAARKKQREVFDQQIAFAVSYDLPLVLHIRSAPHTINAHTDALSILDRAQETYGDKVRGTCHFFTAPIAVAKEYWARGFMVSLPGVITFAQECEEVVRCAPQDLIVVETDSPYAAPMAHRGGRNEPAYVVEIVRHIAHLRKEEEAHTALYLAHNARRLFRLE